MGLVEIERVVSVGKSCDLNLRALFAANGVPFLTSCNNVLIAIFAGNQKNPFVKFAYKPTAGYKTFIFEALTDEANGKALLAIESEDTIKAIEGIVRLEMSIDVEDTVRADLGFDTNKKQDLFKFI